MCQLGNYSAVGRQHVTCMLGIYGGEGGKVGEEGGRAGEEGGRGTQMGMNRCLRDINKHEKMFVSPKEHIDQPHAMHECRTMTAT